VPTTGRREEVRLLGVTVPELLAKLRADPRLSGLADLVTGGPKDVWGLRAAARACGLGQTQLNVQLRRVTGLTCHQLRTRLRVLQALSLLREPDARLIDVCFDAGFGSIPSFYRSFARLMGVPPSSLRARPVFSRRRNANS